MCSIQFEGDKKAEEIMEQALMDVNKKLARRMKQQYSESQYPPSSHASDSIRSVVVEG